MKTDEDRHREYMDMVWNELDDFGRCNPDILSAVKALMAAYNANRIINSKLEIKCQRQRQELRRLNARLKGIWEGVRFANNTVKFKYEHDREEAILRMNQALALIATPMRPDGTWNRDREACRELAEKALTFP